MIEEIILFSTKVPDKQILLIIVGEDEVGDKMSRIQTLIEPIDSITLCMTGNLSPIPRKLIEISDLFIGVSGSAIMTQEEGEITITVDAEDGTALGILGYNTKEYVLKRNGITLNRPLNKYLFEVFFECNLEEIRRFLQDTVVRNDNNKDLEEHIRFIQNSSTTKEWYNFGEFSIIEKCRFFWCRLLGFDYFQKFENIRTNSRYIITKFMKEKLGKDIYANIRKIYYVILNKLLRNY